MKNEHIKLNSLVRSVDITTRDINKEARTVDLAFSSEAPVERWFGTEILDHAPGSVRLDRIKNKGPLLMDHDYRAQVGVVESVTLDGDRKGRVRVRFGKSARAKEVFNDVQDGIRAHVSVGYRVHEAVLEQTGEGVTDTYRITDWEPLEVSLVSVPADPTVGVGRQDDNSHQARIITPKLKERVIMSEKKTAPAAEKPEIQPESKAPAKPSVENIRDQELERMRKITEFGDKYGMRKQGVEFIRTGKSAEAFYEYVLKNLDQQARTQPVTHLDLTEKEKGQYSLMRAINACVTGKWKGAEFELETSNAIADKLGREARGFFVPFDVQTRDLTVTSGAGLVGTDHLASSFIDNLRAQALMGQLGATFLTGLIGNVDIPKLAGSAGFYWLGDDEDVTDSDPTIGSVALSPTTVAGSVPMSRRLLKQSDPSVEMLVLNDLVQGAALAIDKAALEGTGATNQPTGIVNQTGVNTVTVADVGKVPTFAEAVDFETQVAIDNALMGSLAYVTTPTIAGGMKTTAKDAGSGLFVMENGQVNGYPVRATSQLTAGTTVFGNFNDVLIGMWGVLDVNPDTATKAASGGLVLRVFQDVDVAVRHAESFAVSA